MWYSNDSYLPASKHLARTRGAKTLWDYDSWEGYAESYREQQRPRGYTPPPAKGSFLGYRDTGGSTVLCTSCYGDNVKWINSYYKPSDWRGVWSTDLESMPVELQVGLACEYCGKHLLTCVGSC